MPIATDSTQKSIILQELANKVNIEVRLEKEIKKVFKKIVSDYKELLEVKKKGINFETEYAEELQRTLLGGYSQAQREAVKFFVKDPVVRSILSEQELLVIRNNTVRVTNEYLNKRAVSISKELLDTTKQNLEDAYTYVDKLNAEQELGLTEAERDSMVMDSWQTRLDNRAETISVTETQNAYEKTKQTEGLGITERIARQGYNLQKRWDATLDSRTRPAHAMAHGQRVPVDSCYTVMGQQLEFPGDTSHGATLDNIINCRCSSQFVIIQ